MRKLLPMLVALLLCSFAKGQQTGTITGTLSDKENGNSPLPFANVIIKGTTKGTTTDFDGLFTIDNLEPGTYNVEFSFVGYETKTMNNVAVGAGETVTLNTALNASAATLDDVVITADVNREKESALLIEQKKAVEIKQAIGAQELARKGVSDAESAVTKVSGISKQQGIKNVFVRGLGDRYNATTLNGLPLPSEDPEYKNIALDFFSSDIIKSVGISKTYGVDNYGDMGGAIIDIQSKELTKESIYKISAGTGFNSRAVSKNFLTLDEGTWIGRINNRKSDITDLNFYNFENSFRPSQQSLQPNTSLSFQVGKRLEFDNSSRLKIFITGNLDSDYQYRRGQANVVNAQGGFGRRLEYEKYIYQTNQLLMGNLDFGFESGNISFNSLLVHSSDQEVADYFGFAENISEESDCALIRRQLNTEEVLWVNQIIGEFDLTERLSLYTGLTYNNIYAYEPDRRTNVYTLREGEFRPALGSPGLTNRFFSDLEEKDLAAKFFLDYTLGDIDGESFKADLKIGGDFRQTDREFNFTQFNHDFRQPVVVDINNPDELFSQSSIDDGTFSLVTNRGSNSVGLSPLLPFFYTGDRTIVAGFLNSNLIFNEKITLSLGVRFESIEQITEFDTNLSSSVRDLNTAPSIIEETYLLPSITAKYNFNSNSILRFAASQTYTLPQFKEVAPFLYEDVTFNSFGFPGLVPSKNTNFDLKYEYYFSSGEILSLTGFYKLIDDPINRIAINSAANNLSYRNTGNRATVAGLELEIRKDLLKSSSVSDPENQNKLSVGLNASYLYSNQELDRERSTANFTEDESELQGASPFLLNTDITYSKENENFLMLNSLVLSYFSDRIYSLGTQMQGDLIEKGIPTLDFITKITFKKKYGLSLGFKNLLDPEYQLNQDTIDGTTLIVQNFKRGIVSSIGFTYEF